MHRIWSTDWWWTDAETQTAKLIARLQEMLQIEQAAPANDPLPAGDPPHQESGARAAAATYERQVQVEPVRTVAPRPEVDTRLPHYTTVEVTGGRPESFYEFSADAPIELAMQQIIEAEAPILDAVVYRRVARAWRLERTGTKIVEKLNRIARNFKTTGRAPRRFFWRKTDNPRTWTEFSRRPCGGHEAQSRRDLRRGDSKHRRVRPASQRLHAG